MNPTIKIKRAYAPASKTDGFRILVDRLWPRGIKKTEAAIDEWAKDLAPTTELREWFGHDPEHWPEFQKKYKAELAKNPAVDPFLESHEDKKLITLVYGAKDEAHTHALVLQEYLEGHYHKS
jgi:uncharacterized protein YeaO (DUF488 family)